MSVKVKLQVERQEAELRMAEVTILGDGGVAGTAAHLRYATSLGPSPYGSAEVRCVLLENALRLFEDSPFPC